MRCEVLSCGQSNDNKASTISFFCFPKDASLLKKWIDFCQRENSFNPRTACICMNHFAYDDFANNMQFEMGFAKNRLLKKGVVPTIYNHLTKRKLCTDLKKPRNEGITGSLKVYSIQKHNGKNEDTIQPRHERVVGPLKVYSVRKHREKKEYFETNCGNVNLNNGNNIKSEDESFSNINVKEEYVLPDEYEEQSVPYHENLTINEFPLETKCEGIDWNNLTWICQFCNQNFYGYKSFKSHINLLHQCTRITEHIHHKCVDCGEVFNSYLLFINHIRTFHYTSLQLSCDVCCEMFSNYKELSDHRDQHLGENTMQPAVHYCLQCEEIFSSLEELEDHFLNSHTTAWNCNDGNSDFNYSTNEYGNYEVDYEYHKDRNVSERRMRIHIGEGPFKCEFCTETFKYSRDLNVHMNKQHQNENITKEIKKKSPPNVMNLWQDK